MRVYQIIILAVLASCSNVKKDENNTSPTEPKAVESTQPDGIIIHAQTETDTLKGSPKSYVTSTNGNTNFTINYYSPATRGRTIWGGLVAYNNVWVTGAHKATNIEFDHDIKIGETKVAAGKYAIFTIPGEDQWTVILNKNWNQHLADDYSEAEDVVRLQVTPEVNASHQERLRYVIESASEMSGGIEMSWDKLKVVIPFTIVSSV